MPLRTRLATATRAAGLWAARPVVLRAAVRPLLRAARRALVRAGDPSLPYRIGRVEIVVPLSHDLPFIQAAHPLYDAALARLAAAVWAARPGSSAIDIGANVGDTAAAIRSASPAPILAIEGHPGYAAILRANAARIGDVMVEETLVAAATGKAPGAWRLTAGTGRFANGEGSTAAERLGDIVARHPELPPPALVKIDTDGFDCPIVETGMDLWARWRPALFFEYVPDYYDAGWSPLPMFEGLRSAGYERVLVYDQFGEYLASMPLGDRILLGELHTFYSGRYADFCLWHAQDRDAGEAFRRGEEAAARLPRPKIGSALTTRS